MSEGGMLHFLGFKVLCKTKTNIGTLAHQQLPGDVTADCPREGPVYTIRRIMGLGKGLSQRLGLKIGLGFRKNWRPETNEVGGPTQRYYPS